MLEPAATFDAPAPAPEFEPPAPASEAPATPEPESAPLATEPVAPQSLPETNGQVHHDFEDDLPLRSPPLTSPTRSPPSRARGAGARGPERGGLQRLHPADEGERMTVAECDDIGEAKGYAKALTKQLGTTDTDDWPFVNGRFLKPDTIVSVDVELQLARATGRSAGRRRQPAALGERLEHDDRVCDRDVLQVRLAGLEGLEHRRATGPRRRRDRAGRQSPQALRRRAGNASSSAARRISASSGCLPVLPERRAGASAAA